MAGSLAPAWRRGLHGQERQGGDHRRRFRGSPIARRPVIFPRTSSRRTFVAVGLRRQTTTALPWPRSSTRWRRTHSSICCASTPRSISPPRRPLPGRRRARRQPLSGVVWPRPWRRKWSDRRDCLVGPRRRCLVGEFGRKRCTTHWSGTFVSADGDRSHEWAPGDEGNTFVWPNDSEICGVLKWDEWPAGVSDFDLGLSLSETGQRLAISDDYQSGSQPPYEGLCVTQRSGTISPCTGRSLATTFVARRDSTCSFGDYNLPLQYQTARRSITVTADSRPRLPLEPFAGSRGSPSSTSQGPTIDGRTKPDIAGHDSVSGATYGPSRAARRVAGTSAAAPGGQVPRPREAGIPRLRARSAPAVPREKRSRCQRTRGGQRHGRRRAPAAAAPDVVPPTARALVSTGRVGKTVKAPVGDRGQRGASEPRRAGEAERQGGEDDPQFWCGRSQVAEGRRHPWAGSRQAEGFVPALRRRDRRVGEQEPRELREDRPEVTFTVEGRPTHADGPPSYGARYCRPVTAERDAAFMARSRAADEGDRALPRRRRPIPAARIASRSGSASRSRSTATKLGR